jgi:hypothetical protein
MRRNTKGHHHYVMTPGGIAMHRHIKNFLLHTRPEASIGPERTTRGSWLVMTHQITWCCIQVHS